LSVIIPVYNEAGAIADLIANTLAALTGLGRSYEIVVVDDGSRDDGAGIVEALAKNEPRLKLIRLRRNFGQTAALMAGFDHAAGEILIPMDGDGQNDPADIPALLAKLDEGYDVVSGWRQDRQDHEFGRRLPSRFANRLISWATGVALNDYGCTLKAYRREMLSNVRLYGEMHRFIPVYASWQGARIIEMPVRHHPRRHGESSYGLERTAKIVLDLMVVLFLERYAVKPIYVFGMIGIVSIALSLIAGGGAIALKFFWGIYLITTPLPLAAVFLFLAGMTSILSGLLAEMIMRTYHESQGKPPYSIKTKINL
jgi:dolichol-phosphate mannosyltransferase